MGCGVSRNCQFTTQTQRPQKGKLSFHNFFLNRSIESLANRSYPKNAPDSRSQSEVEARLQGVRMIHQRGAICDSAQLAARP
jgi:hypothetical protein